MGSDFTDHAAKTVPYRTHTQVHLLVAFTHHPKKHIIVIIKTLYRQILKYALQFDVSERKSSSASTVRPEVSTIKIKALYEDIRAAVRNLQKNQVKVLPIHVHEYGKYREEPLQTAVVKDFDADKQDSGLIRELTRDPRET
eukprot:scpid73057/ scgid15076/ 